MNQQLATLERNGDGIPSHESYGAPATRRMTLDEMWWMAEKLAEGGLFPGITRPSAAFTLMMLCEADKLHPVHALRRYHIIEGRPSMKADAMQAEFQADGGKIKLVRRDRDEARAIFSHPVHQPEPVEMFVTMKDIDERGVSHGKYNDKTGKWDLKGVYKKHPASMLWARLISEAITTIHPGIKVGVSSTEEMEDIIATENPPVALALARDKAEGVAAVAASQVKVMGFTGTGIDTRGYVQVVSDGAAFACDAIRKRWAEVWTEGMAAEPPALPDAASVHKYVMNQAIQLGKYEGEKPSKVPVKFLAGLHKSDPDWVRATINEHLEASIERVEAIIGDMDDDAYGAGDDAGANREPGDEG